MGREGWNGRTREEVGGGEGKINGGPEGVPVGDSDWGVRQSCLVLMTNEIDFGLKNALVGKQNIVELLPQIAMEPVKETLTAFILYQSWRWHEPTKQT